MKKFMLSIDEKTHQNLKVLSIMTNKSMNEVIVEAIRKVLKEK
jgi:predicted HicB family RNase H-like nuclease